VSLCSCPDMPGCQWDGCWFPADWSVYQPPWGKSRRARFRFMCDWHFQTYQDAMTKPIRGIDKPQDADDDWRGSILECYRHAKIALDFEERNKAGERK
jgi:hypothetical protein